LTRKLFYDTLTGFSVLKHGWASSGQAPSSENAQQQGLSTLVDNWMLFIPI